MKKTVSLVLALGLILSLTTPALAAEFSDVSTDHWAYSAIQSAAGKGITSGYSDGTFKPSASVTNAQFAVMLARAFYSADVAEVSQGPGAEKNPWWWPAWNVLVFRAKVAKGTAVYQLFSNQPSANDQITRYDMAQLMANILTANGKTVSDSEKSAAQAKIGDWASVPEDYRDAVSTCYALGILGGLSDGTFSGGKTMNRAQGCVVIDRLTQYVGIDPGVVSEIPVVTDPEIVPNSPSNQSADQKPSTEADSGALTLRDGSAVTEENVLNRIQAILKDYPAGAPWGDSNYGLNAGLRDNNVTIGGYDLGMPSGAITTIRNRYTTFQGGALSMTGGCGGFAGLVSDAVFGGSNRGGDNFPIRKLDSVADVRPGDILIEILADGTARHVLAAASSAITGKFHNGVQNYEVTVYHGGGYNGGSEGTVLYNTNYRISDDIYNDYSRFEAWTRYPD